MKKTTVLNALNELPKEFRLDQLIERLIVLDKIEAGLKDAAEGKTVSHESAKKMVAKWLK